MIYLTLRSVSLRTELFGDLFDIAFKANRRNYRLLKNHLAQPKRQTARDRLFLAITMLVVLACIALPVIALIKLLKYI